MLVVAPSESLIGGRIIEEGFEGATGLRYLQNTNQAVGKAKIRIEKALCIKKTPRTSPRWILRVSPILAIQVPFSDTTELTSICPKLHLSSTCNKSGNLFCYGHENSPRSFCFPIFGRSKFFFFECPQKRCCELADKIWLYTTLHLS